MIKRHLLFTVLWISAFLLVAKDQKGLFDFHDQKDAKVFSLDGKWEFYWEKLIAPGDFPDTASIYFDFPALWNDQEIGGKQLDNFGYATYRSQVMLPLGQKYTLHVEDMYSAFRLFVNGKDVYENGVVSDKAETYQPSWKPKFLELQELKDTNEFVLQIANFDHAKGGALEGIEIGESSYMADQKLGIEVRDLILTGSLLMGGLFFLGLYFFGRHDRAILYFSLFCMVYSYRIIGFGFYIFHSIVDWPWQVTTRLEYISLFLSTFFFGQFVKHLYPREVSALFWKALSGVCLAFIVLASVAPAWIYSRSIEPFFILLLIYLVLTLFIYIKARIRKRPGSSYAMLSTAVVFFVFAYNILVYFGVLRHWESATFWGYMLFFFSQSLILSYRFAFFLKDAKRQAELAVVAKTDFLSTISHEIRTPLNAVVGISHFMLMDNPREDQKDNLHSLKYSAEHLTSLINDILDYNKLESGFVEFEALDTDLVDVINGIYKAYNARAQSKGIGVKLDYDQQIRSTIITDRTRLIQILSNLMDNAVKFTKEGEITLAINCISQQESEITLRFSISDTGVGISKDKQELIFERFTQASSSTTREFGGTGLGLSIIKRLLELQGSKIEVSSEPGKGATFFFTQTFKKGGEVKTKLVDFQEQYQVNKLFGRRVLLVEDNAMNVMVAKKFLDKWKLKIDTANNGQEAVDMVTANFYDIVLMDLQMPIMDGFEAAKMIRKTGNKVPIVALTASVMVSIQENVKKAGMNDYVTKPFNPDDLKNALIKNLLN